MKTLEYPLPALTLNFEQCNKIMKVVKKGLLKKSRVSTSIPNDALYGPEDEGGINYLISISHRDYYI